VRIKTNRILLIFCLYALLVVSSPLPARSQITTPPIGVLNNGLFVSPGENFIRGWANINQNLPVTAGTEGADTYIAMKTVDSTSTTGISQTVPLQQEWSKVLLRGYIRVIVQSATLSSFIGAQLSWLNSSGKPIGQITAQSWLATTPGWVEVNQLLDVPDGATSLVISPEVSNAQASAYCKSFSLVGWVSTFQETFAGTTLDPGRWNVTTGKHDVSSNEQEWFDPSQVTVKDNLLDLRAEQKTEGGFPFVSGQISTVNKFQQLYGIFEFRLKLPVTSGAWPAAYLLSWDDHWPPEIDVEELSGAGTDIVLETNHYADDYDRHRSSSVNFGVGALDRTQWHTYTVVWEPGEVAWYIDNNYEGTTGEPYGHVSDDPMYITLNLAVGAYGGDPSLSTWPRDFYCSEVNVYQRNDLPLPVYPEPSHETTLPNKTVNLSAISCIPFDPKTITWSLLEGPGKAIIAFPHAMSTQAYVTVPGMYRFQIQVTKGLSTGSAQLLAYVNSALGAQ
jgi:beta-glucanase (GH16 family)